MGVKPGSYIKVSAEVWNLTDLRPRERVFLALLVSFSREGGTCTMSNAALGELFNCSARSIRDYLHRLKAGGYVIVTHDGGRKIKAAIPRPPAAKNRPASGEKLSAEAAKNLHHIQKNRIDDKNIYMYEGKNRPTEEQAAQLMRDLIETRKEFQHLPREVAPTMARECLAYYASTGDKTRNGKIVRWPPVLEAWVRRNAERAPKTKRPKRENTASDIRWHERRAESWRKRAAALAPGDPQRADFEKYARDEQRTADHIKQQLSQ